jgi:alkaline phosphatase D
MGVHPFFAGPTRRNLLRGGAALLLTGGLTTRVWAQPVFARDPFTLGVASGDPLPDGVVLWTRLAPDPLSGGGMPMAAVEVAWEIAADDRMRNIVRRGAAMARPELGHAVHVEASGLEPAREYWFRFRVGREASPIGRTKTAPAATNAVQQIRFALCGCNRYEDGYFTAFRHLAEERPDFAFHYGDYIYEYRERLDRVRRVQGDEIHTLVDYRNRYAQYKLDRDLQAAHAATPFVVSFDDHEVDNNWAGAISEEPDVPPELLLLRRAMAFQAWYENMPVRRAQLPRGPDIVAHRRLLFGDLLALNVLDTRQHRSDQPCGDGVKPRCEAVDDPRATMLGAEQERWLFDGLAASRARWNVLAQQVMVMRRRMTANPATFAMDKWDGYAVAQRRLHEFLAERRPGNPVVLTGDVHNAWVGELKSDYDRLAGPSLGVEFVATSISSNGDGGDTRPETAQMLADNPHIKFFNDLRGYTLCELTPQRWTAHFRVLDKVTMPGFPMRNRASFVIEAGRNVASLT